MDVGPAFKPDAVEAAELANRLARCVVPLMQQRHGKVPTLVGTGFLVSYGAANFLVSAAHVLDQHEHLFFYVKPGVVRNLTGGAIVSTSLDAHGKRHGDRADVAVFRFDEAPPPYPEVEKFATPVAELWPHGQQSREKSRYMLVGFPGTRTRANPVAKMLTSELFSFRNVSAPTADYERLSISSDTHIVMPMNLQKTIDDDGRIKVSPDPHGLSGSPIFLLPRPGDRDRSMPIVGVAIEHHRKHHLLVASDIRYALGAMNTALKDTQPT